MVAIVLAVSRCWQRRPESSPTPWPGWPGNGAGQGPAWLKSQCIPMLRQQQTGQIVLARLLGQVIDEAHGLGEGAVVAVVAEAGREIGIECGGLVTKYRGRKEGR